MIMQPMYFDVDKTFKIHELIYMAHKSLKIVFKHMLRICVSESLFTKLIHIFRLCHMCVVVKTLELVYFYI